MAPDGKGQIESDPKNEGATSPPGGPGIEACKRAKPMFAGVFAFSEAGQVCICHARKSGFGPMFGGLGTLVRFEQGHFGP